MSHEYYILFCSNVFMNPIVNPRTVILWCYCECRKFLFGSVRENSCKGWGRGVGIGGWGQGVGVGCLGSTSGGLGSGGLESRDWGRGDVVSLKLP